MEKYFYYLKSAFSLRHLRRCAPCFIRASLLSTLFLQWIKVSLITMFAGLTLAAGMVPAYGAQGMPELEFGRQSISANISKATLGTILQKIIAEKGIWFKGTDRVLQEEVSARFVNLPIEYGLKKILRNLNYSLIFDANQSVVGVIVLGRNAGQASDLEDNNRTPVAMEETSEDEFSIASYEASLSDESQEDDSANSELPFLPHDYQFE